MAEKKRFAQGVNVGSSSILVTFVLLCLVTFAALAFVSANSDYKLSKQTAERTTRFYEANHMAEVFLLNIESQIRMKFNDSNNESDFYNGIEGVFADNDSVTVEKLDNNEIHLNYSVAISDKQKLDVTLCTSYNDFMNTDSVSIEKWQTVTTYSGDEPTLQDNNINLLFTGE